MHEAQYKGIVLKIKQFLKAPLELDKEVIRPNATYSYSVSDVAFLSQQWANQNNAYYFNLCDFLEAVYLRDTQQVNNFKEQIRTHEKIICPTLPIITDPTQEHLDTYWLDLFRELKSTLKNPLLEERRLVIPLQVVFPDMVSHAAVSCFNFKPQKDAVDVIVLEQHAQKKGKADYDADFDYTKGIQLHAKAWTEVMKLEDHGFLGIQSVNTFVNDDPICRRHDVCCVVATEVARQLLVAEDPMKLVQSGIKIAEAEVDTLHARNQELEKKYGKIWLKMMKDEKQK